MNIEKLLDEFSEKEEEFFSSEIVSPVVKGCPIVVNIDGIKFSLHVQDKNFEGWGVFKIIEQKFLEFIRVPSKKEIDEYLKLQRKFTFIICDTDYNRGVLINQKDFSIEGLVPIFLLEGAQLFDVVNTFYDGDKFIFYSLSNKKTILSNNLRSSLKEEILPKQLNISGITPSEFLAYEIVYALDEKNRISKKERDIREVLESNNAVLNSYIQRGNNYLIRYSVNGQNYSSVIEPETMRIVNYGICYDDKGHAFDLESFLPIIRGGMDNNLIYRTS